MNAAQHMATSMSSLFTPTILFCFVNLVIGTIFITSRLKSHKKPDPAVNSPPNQLVRVPSFLDRVKSFNFSSYHSEQPDLFHSSTQHADPKNVEDGEVLLETHHDDHQMTRGKSETSVAAKGGPAKRTRKSFSEKAVVAEEPQEEVDRRLPATMRERKGSSSETKTLTFNEDEAVDKKADDFINRFRQQLKLQRLDSLLRHKEMLNRGVGVGSGDIGVL